jgi:hypothetical protein
LRRRRIAGFLPVAKCGFSATFSFPGRRRRSPISSSIARAMATLSLGVNGSRSSLASRSGRSLFSREEGRMAVSTAAVLAGEPEGLGIDDAGVNRPASPGFPLDFSAFVRDNAPIARAREDRAHDPPTCAARVRDSSCYARCCMPTRWDSGAVAAASIAGSENAGSPLAWPVAPRRPPRSFHAGLVRCRRRVKQGWSPDHCKAYNGV